MQEDIFIGPALSDRPEAGLSELPPDHDADGVARFQGGVGMSKYCDEILICPYYPRCYDVGYCIADGQGEPEDEGWEEEE